MIVLKNRFTNNPTIQSILDNEIMLKTALSHLFVSTCEQGHNITKTVHDPHFGDTKTRQSTA